MSDTGSSLGLGFAYRFGFFAALGMSALIGIVCIAVAKVRGRGPHA